MGWSGKTNKQIKRIKKNYGVTQAAIRAEVVPNVMKVSEFNEEFCTDISQPTFSEYVPREIGNSIISEVETAPYENEFRKLLNFWFCHVAMAMLRRNPNLSE